MSKYIVGGLGLWVDSSTSSDPGPRTAEFYPAGTTIDDSLPQWAFLAKRGPPIDAAPLTWDTYYFMISGNGVLGLGYEPWLVNTRFLPPTDPFVLDVSRLDIGALGSGGPAVFGPPSNQRPIVGDVVDYWGRPTPWIDVN